MVVLALLSSLLTVTAPRAGADKDITFLGFSRNDAVSAWRVTTHRRQPSGDVDHFSLVRLIDTKTNKLVATLRDSPVTRTSPDGQKRVVSERQLSTDNPEYQQAGPRGLWPKLKHKGHFTFVQLSFKNNTVRLLPDQDSQVSYKIDDKKLLHVQAKPGQPLGFVPVARLFEGEMMPLGHFRLEGNSQDPLRADLKVFHSHSGVCIAVLNTFHMPEAPDHTISEAVVLRTSTSDPIGSTDMGMFEMIEAQEQSAEMEFKSMHPSEARNYDIYVGRWF